MENPYDIKAGNVKTNIMAGNSQGVFYDFGRIKEDGELTITLNKVTSGVECDITVTRICDNIPRSETLSSNSEDGKSVTIEVYEDDVIEIIVAVLPDEKFQYPAATVDWDISLS